MTQSCEGHSGEGRGLCYPLRLLLPPSPLPLLPPQFVVFPGMVKLRGHTVSRPAADTALQCPHLTSCGRPCSSEPLVFLLDGIRSSAPDGEGGWCLLLPGIFPAPTPVSLGNKFASLAHTQTLPLSPFLSFFLCHQWVLFNSSNRSFCIFDMSTLQGNLERPTMHLFCFSGFPLAAALTRPEPSPQSPSLSCLWKLSKFLPRVRSWPADSRSLSSGEFP